MNKMDILNSNLKLMQSNKAGGMIFLVSNESLGMTAGTWKGFSCITANFFYDDDGKIIEFSNMGSPDSQFNFGGFRIAMDFRNEKFGIVNVEVYPDSPKTAQVKLVESAKEYNKLILWPEADVELVYLGRHLGQK